MNFKPMEDLCDNLTKWRIPGNAISIYKDGKEVFSYASGYEDMENKIPMNGDRLLFMYSCSKIATTLAALQLYEKDIFFWTTHFMSLFRSFGIWLIKMMTEISKAVRSI